jgi:RNA polymerase sigma factor (TIGR02999 family)
MRDLEKAGEITELLSRWRRGSEDVENELFNLVNADLRRLAHYVMRGERKGHSLQATELVDQVYIRLVAAKDRDWQNRQHFFALAARSMRRHLIDLARARPRAEFIGIEKAEAQLPAASAKIALAVTIDKLLQQLGKEHPDWCNLVELKYFLGLTDEESAEIMGVKLRTAQRMWRDARQWLFERMESARAASNAG